VRILYKESYTVDYAGFWVRLAAFIIDGIILAGLTYVINGIWGVATGVGWMGTPAEQLAEEVVASSSTWVWQALAVFSVQVLYFTGFWAWRGQTPGKMAMRIKIVHFDGTRIGWGGAVLRYLGYMISSAIIFIGFFWIAVDNRRQGIHDKIAETYVISAQKN
jgi:uncharacterized RDD family membrane protein YckC